MDIKHILENLTTEEKIGQLLQLAPFSFISDIEVEVFGHLKDLGLTHKKVFSAGSVLGIHNATEMISVQKKYLEKTTHNIPLIFMADIIHGYETIFPVPLALSASWSPKLAYEMARISAIEAQTAGIHVTFSPMADLSRDPRWGRVVEGFGEDAYLNEVFVSQMVKGYQQDDLKKDGTMAACVKHFAAYGAAEGGKDYNTVDVSKTTLHNYYLKGYKAAIDAGARAIMTSFNVLDGIPATINKYLLRDLLRDTWHFSGLTITDYDALHQVIAHGNAEDNKEAAYKGIKAGLDIEMASSCYINHLKALIDEKRVDMALLDEAVMRVLALKEAVGLFDNPFKGANPALEKTLVRSKNHLEISKKVAHESAVLLKNHGVLPLSKTKTYALIGPYAQTKNTNGPWSWHGKNEDNSTLEKTLTDLNITLKLVRKVDQIETLDTDTINILKTVDAVILALGEDDVECGEAHSKADIRLPRHQDLFVKVLNELGIPSIVLLYHGRPFDLTNIMTADAILDVYYLGSMAHEAIADLLTGRINPSGKLTMSYPRHGGQIPIYYNHLNTGRPKLEGSKNPYVSYYLDESSSPLFPFGYGLSYTTFDYQHMNVSKEVMRINEAIFVSIDITNQGTMAGYETVQLYIRDYVAMIARPVKELKGFQKIWLEPKETKTVSFELSSKDLSYLDEKGNSVIEPGRFAVMVGSSSDKLSQIDIILKED